MRPSHYLALTAAIGGAAAAAKVLARRHRWEQVNNLAAICVDLDDVTAAAIRAGVPLADMFARLAEAGATHISLPEWTLHRLLMSGALTVQAPQKPLTDLPPFGHWCYFHGHAGLVGQLAEELQARLPQTEARLVGRFSLAFAGDIPTIGEIGLGFDSALAGQILRAGLAVVPRPVNYAWPDPALLTRTLAQAAQLGRYIAFAGDMILGHEMHLDVTVRALTDNDLIFVYFAETRHQKGDWFVAKRRAPHVVLGHQFSPTDMVPLDYHAACHNWVRLARERGVRFCYVNFFRVLHATAPLEGLDYVHHLKHALEDAGLVLAQDPAPPTPTPAPHTASLAAAGVAAAGVSAPAVVDLLQLPESIAFPLTVLSIAGAATLPYLERARLRQATEDKHGAQDHHHHDHNGDHHHGHHHHHDHEHDHSHADLHALYPPSYAPKLLGLAAAAFGPIAAQNNRLVGAVFHSAAIVALAAVTSGREYQLRVEEYRGFNLDWAVPLGALLQQLPDRRIRAAALTGLAIGWLAAQRRGMDLLVAVDPDHAEGHTHHISTAMATLGDIQKALGVRPARKWSGLGPLAGGAASLFEGDDRAQGAFALRTLSTLGYTLSLVGFRRPERALAETWRLAGPSLSVGTAAGLALEVVAGSAMAR